MCVGHVGLRNGYTKLDIITYHVGEDWNLLLQVKSLPSKWGRLVPIKEMQVEPQELVVNKTKGKHLLVHHKDLHKHIHPINVLSWIAAGSHKCWIVISHQGFHPVKVNM